MKEGLLLGVLGLVLMAVEVPVAGVRGVELIKLLFACVAGTPEARPLSVAVMLDAAEVANPVFAAKEETMLVLIVVGETLFCAGDDAALVALDIADGGLLGDVVDGVLSFSVVDGGMLLAVAAEGGAEDGPSFCFGVADGAEDVPSSFFAVVVGAMLNCSGFSHGY